MPLTAKDAITALIADPKAFLTRHHLTIAGGDKTASEGKAVFTLVENPGAKHTAKVEQVWRLTRTSKDPTGGIDDDCEFVAFYVPMRQCGDDVLTTHVKLPGTGTDDFMITSKLSGCTFGAVSTRGGTTVSHMQPPGGTSENRKLAKQAVKHGMPGGLFTRVHTFYKGTDYSDTAAVVGKRVAGKWKFFCQSQNYGDGGYDIVSIAKF